MKKVKVNLVELVDAWECGSPEFRYFLDLETGEVIMLTEEDNSALEGFFDQVDSEGDESEETIRERFEEWLKDFSDDDYQRDTIRSALLIEQQYGKRFIRIPVDEPHDGYHDMVDFASTVNDQHLQNLLSVALDGKGAFRRFKNVLYDYPQEKERWCKYSRECKEQRIREWLESEEVEIEPDGGPC